MQIFKVLITKNTASNLDYIIKFVGPDLRVGSITDVSDYRIKKQWIDNGETFVTFDFIIAMNMEHIFIENIEGKIMQ